jgi:diaminopimelate decarboxylase
MERNTIGNEGSDLRFKIRVFRFKEKYKRMDDALEHQVTAPSLNLGGGFKMTWRTMSLREWHLTINP